ncbi:glycosyltransferase family 2 protein [Limosilactobacillus mucosae]|uniref:glycosyltransferase family 2 protein n=1 Tax=Limosilactobacillus mucosae TaxID=97478 RepID=UPI0039948D3A
MPKVTVIVPAYNAEKYIKKCIQSLLSQTLKDIELIFINDGSTDNTREIIETAIEGHNNAKLYNQKNKGLYRTREIGLSLANGEYIGWVDADDFVKPEMYEILYNCALSKGSDLVYCNYSWFPQKVKAKEKWFRPYVGKRDVNFIERNSQPWNKIVKKSLLIDLGIQNHFVDCFDEVYIDVLLNAKNPISIDKKLYYYRVGGNTMSSSYKKIEHYREFINSSKALKNFLKNQCNKYWKDYFDYRIIYYYIITMLVAANDGNYYEYKKLKHDLLKKYQDFEKNQHYKAILNFNYGKIKSIFFRKVVPNNYFITWLACKILFN